MRMRNCLVLAGLTILMIDATAMAQVSSLGARRRTAEAERTPAERAIAEEEAQERGKVNPVYERYSWITGEPIRATQFRGQRSDYGDHPGECEVRGRRRCEERQQLRRQERAGCVPETHGWRLGAATFHRGKPNIDYNWSSQTDNQADTSREDKYTTRITVRVIDVKPNGLLVLEGTDYFEHDDEQKTITLTGVCRKEDVTADNTVLSTEIANKEIKVETEGAVRDGSRRGWLLELIEAVRPF
jgi:hypothetical protein